MATSNAQTLKKFAVLPCEFLPVDIPIAAAAQLGLPEGAGGEAELTATLKLKRSTVHKKYLPTIKALYGGDFVPCPWGAA